MVLNHLLEFEWDDDGLADPATAPVSLDDASVPVLLDAQARTADWLDKIGAHSEPAKVPTIDEAAKEAARAAFCSVTNPYQDPLKAKADLMAMSAPPAVRHLAGMLSQYDWAFVRQAQEIRGYIVARLVEHAQNLDPKISLAALKTLGTVTEISAYTTRLEIDHRQADVTPDAVVERLRSKLQSLLPAINAAAGGVEDAVVIDGQQ